MKDDAHLTEHQLDSESVFNGLLLHVRRDRVRMPDGHEAVREYIVHPGAVVMIPVLPNGSLVMERQFRYPLNRVFYELPAGKVNGGEDRLATAKRELLEETGYVADAWTWLGCIHPVISYSSEQIDLYLAERLSLKARQLDHGEFLDVVEMPLGRALDMVRDGEITDAKTIAGLFWVERVLNGSWSRPEFGA